jgi:hypothetical protein
VLFRGAFFEVTPPPATRRSCAQLAAQPRQGDWELPAYMLHSKPISAPPSGSDLLGGHFHGSWMQFRCDPKTTLGVISLCPGAQTQPKRPGRKQNQGQCRHIRLQTSQQHHFAQHAAAIRLPACPTTASLVPLSYTPQQRWHHSPAKLARHVARCAARISTSQ